MQEKQKNLIRYLAIVIATTTIFSTIYNWPNVWGSISYSFRLDSFDSYALKILIILIPALCLLPIAKIITAFGLFRLRPWGRTTAIFVFSIDLLVRIYFTYYLLSQHLGDPENTRKFFSLLPNYILGLISLVTVILLLLKQFKEAFSKPSLKLKQDIA